MWVIHLLPVRVVWPTFQVYSKELEKFFLVHNDKTSSTVHLCTFLKYRKEESTLWNAPAGKVTLYRKHSWQTKHSWLLSLGRNFTIHKFINWCCYHPNVSVVGSHFVLKLDRQIQTVSLTQHWLCNCFFTHNIWPAQLIQLFGAFDSGARKFLCLVVGGGGDCAGTWWRKMSFGSQMKCAL